MAKDKKISVTHGNNNEQESYLKYAGSKSEILIKEFGTSLNGLSDNVAKKLLKKYGYNEPAKKERISIAKLLLSKFFNPLIVLLIIIVIVSLFFAEEISAMIVSLMILLSVSLEFIQEYRSGKEVEKLNELIRTRVTIYRNGKGSEIDIREIVPGDIVQLYAGDMVPADLRIISCKDLFINCTVQQIRTKIVALYNYLKKEVYGR